MINIAILGFGTVGSGVAEVLDTNGASIAHRVSEPVEVKYILDLRPQPESPWADRFVTDFSVIEQDPDVSIVVESIGGVGAALDFTRRALSAGKHVVTSNKELVAEHGFALLALAKEHGVRYLFEASVGGGIPIIHPLYQCLCANEISAISGILNGTTNYILTRMIRAGLSFEAALKEAQEKGYAEADPSADVEGKDACRKICILADICFGRHVSPALVPTVGITGVSDKDVAAAAACGCKVKLFGRAVRLEDGRVCAFVEPHFVPNEAPLASVEDVFNAISVTGNAIGDVMFYGRGAGKLPTASAVVADVMDVARGMDLKFDLGWGPGGPEVLAPVDGMADRWCVRAGGDRAALLAALPGAEAVDFDEAAVLTGPMTRPALEAALAEVKVLGAYRVLNA